MNTNICEVTELNNLIYLLKNNLTVILGLVTEETSINECINIRKFLKGKSKIYPALYFVYMKVRKENMGTLGIISKEAKVYPLLFHIRNGTDVLIRVENATLEEMNKSFDVVEKYYIKDDVTINEEKDDKLEQKKITEKILLLTEKYHECKLDLIKNISNRKQIENSA